MTAAEHRAACALSSCTFLPGCFDKRFVKQLPRWQNRTMTEKGRAMLLKLTHKYRRQIPNHVAITNAIHLDKKVIEKLDTSNN